MAMHPETPTTKDEKTAATKTPTRGESAVRHLWKRATEAGKEEEAALIAKVANLLMPEIKLSAGLPFEKPADSPKKATVNTAQIDGAEVDISQMADQDAADYAAYAAEMDGSAALERHIQRLEDEDAEMREIGRRNAG
jgi:hypothetical protein